MNDDSKLSKIERQSAIRDILQSRDSVAIPALAKEYGVSEMTVRRDLDTLEATGQVRRTHGGATPAERMVFDFNFVTRRRANLPAKQAIVAKAAEMIKPGQRIIIDTGTTSLELATLIKDMQQLTVLTPSLAVASQLQFSEGIQTVLLGGEIRRGSPDLTGLVTETVLDMFTVDLAFQGADAIGTDGAMYTADMRISRVDQKIREQAEQTYVLADSSKLGQTALVRHGFVSEVKALITDDQIDPKIKIQLEKCGANILTVPIK